MALHPEINLNDLLPAAPAGKTNVQWQIDNSVSPPNVSAYYSATGGSSTLASDTDVSITSPADGQLLIYKGSDAKWENRVLSAGDIPNLAASKITSGQLALAQGGTGVDLSAAGGTGFVLKINGSHVISAAALVAADIPDISATYALASDVAEIETDLGELTTDFGLCELLSHKDAHSGYAGLDSSGLLKTAEFPALTGDVTSSSGGVTTKCAAIQGNPVDSTSLGAGQDGYILTWVNSTAKWTAKSLTSVGNANASQIRGETVATGVGSAAAAQQGQALTWVNNNSDIEFSNPVPSTFFKRYGYVNFSGTSLALSPNFDNATNSSVWSSATYIAGQIPGGGTEYYDGSGAGHLAGAYVSGTAGHSNWGTGQNLGLQVTMCAYTRVNTDIRWWVGWCDNNTPDTTFGASDTPSGKYACIRFSTIAGDSKFTCISSDGSAQTTTVTGTAPSNQVFYKFQVVFDDATPAVRFYINGAMVATHTTHLPTSTTGTPMYWMAGMSRVTTAIHALINNIQVWGD